MNPKLGDYFYKISSLSKAKVTSTLHKINYINYNTDVFEWGVVGKTSCGWAEVSELKMNHSYVIGVSKVKWLLILK